MTTFQDPPPQSRRAVRQSERGENPDQLIAQPRPYSFDPAGAAAADTAVVPPAGTTPADTTPADTASTVPTSTAGAQTPSQDADANSQPLAGVTYIASGRRVQLPASAPLPTGEPLPSANNDGTDSGSVPKQPSTADQFEQRVAPPTGDAYTQQNLSAQRGPDLGNPNYRVRDFSPEGGRRSMSRDQFTNVASAPPPTMAPNPAAPTSGAAPTGAPASPATPAAAAPTSQVGPSLGSHAALPSVTDDDVMNHTLTRRELRELRAEAERNAPSLKLPDPIDTLVNSGPIEIPTLAPAPGQSQALADAMAEFDSLTRARREAEASARDAQVASLQTPILPAPAVQAQVAPPVEPVVFQQAPVSPPPLVAPSEPVAPSSIEVAPVEATLAAAEQVSTEPVTLAQHVAETPPLHPVWPEPVAASPAPAAAAPVAASVPEAPVVAPPLVEPVASTRVPSAPSADPLFLEPGRAASIRPTNHWSVQAELDDDDDLPYENTLTRTVGPGTSAITTSALVLPSVPQASDLTNPFAATGEILVTGSIDLPHSLGSTGAHPLRVDNSDFEDDPLDNEVTSADAAPIRAIRAVSTHTSTRGVIESKRPPSNRLLTAVIIIGGALALGVIGLLAYAIFTHKF